MTTTLTSRQRQYLKGLAHPLSPVVRVGKAGLTEAVVRETTSALRAHELVKVRIEDEPAARRAIAEDLARGADAQLVGSVGKVTIVYRRRVDDPGIELPT